jgi:integrase
LISTVLLEARISRYPGGYRLRVKDFHLDGEQATLTINEKGNKHRTIGIHFAAAEALTEYLGKAGLEAGAIFRARRAVHSGELGDNAMSEASMYRVIAGYVGKLPGAVKEGAQPLQHPLPPRRHRYPAAGCRRRYPQGSGTVGPPLRHHHPDLR